MVTTIWNYHWTFHKWSFAFLTFCQMKSLASLENLLYFFIWFHRPNMVNGNLLSNFFVKSKCWNHQLKRTILLWLNVTLCAICHRLYNLKKHEKHPFRSDTFSKVASWSLQLLSICDALRNLVSFVQFKKCEIHPWRSVTFSKVARFRII